MKTYKNPNGPLIAAQNLNVIEKDGLWFKDMSRTGQLLPYEDWRNSPEERAEDLAGRLSMEEIAGLMIYTAHQHVPYRNTNTGLMLQYYGGREFEESGAEAYAVTDEQKEMISKSHIRHFLMANIDDPVTAAHWTNELQAEAEAQPWAIPAAVASDPRHGAGSDTEYKIGATGFSQWPEGTALAGTFDPDIYYRAADTMRKELRAMGVTTFLGPQIDLATEPRWMRFMDTFGSDLEWNKKLTGIFCDAMQTTKGAPDGWGPESVAVMVKHWPGGGTGEGGRDAHYAYGAYGVFPGGNFELHQKPFVESAFCLKGPTGRAAAVMPYYTVSWLEDVPESEKVGNSFNKFLIQDLLRGTCAYDGIVCTDWGVAEPMSGPVESFAGKCYGAEHLSDAEKCLKILLAGVDQIAGNIRQESIMEAFRLGCEQIGETVMEERFRTSAKRLLLNLFRLGLFENPYVDLEQSAGIFTEERSRAAGYEAQKHAAVLLKNKNHVLPLKEKIRVYLPDRHIDPKINFFAMMDEAKDFAPVPADLLGEYFVPVRTPEEADAAIVWMDSPDSIGYLHSDVEAGGNGYLPISLQYGPYKASAARAVSVAGGDPREDFTNRSYRDKEAVVYNRKDLENLMEVSRRMEGKPVIACVKLNHPFVPAELDPFADAILADPGVSKRVLLDILTGRAQPKGRLAFDLPRDMESVELHCEDTPFDFPAYKDSEGNTYGFGYGMDWNGVLPEPEL